MIVNESYNPVLAAANSTTTLIGANGGSIGGFLCTVAGVLNVQYTVGGVKIVDTLAVVASVFYPLPFTFGPGRAVDAVLSGGAAGTFGVA